MPYGGKWNVNGKEIGSCSFLMLEKQEEKAHYIFPSGNYRLTLNDQDGLVG
ncbi:MAG: hypothetical protein WAO03_10685 [Petrimonas mucosa]